MRISDWSSDVCSSDLALAAQRLLAAIGRHPCARPFPVAREIVEVEDADILVRLEVIDLEGADLGIEDRDGAGVLPEAQIIELPRRPEHAVDQRSEEHTSELQSLMRISYAVFCLKKKKTTRYSDNQRHIRRTREQG